MVVLYRRFGTTYRPIFQSQTWHLKVGPTGCPETSVQNYHSTLYKSPKELRSQTPAYFLESVLLLSEKEPYSTNTLIIQNLYVICHQIKCHTRNQEETYQQSFPYCKGRGNVLLIFLQILIPVSFITLSGISGDRKLHINIDISGVKPLLRDRCSVSISAQRLIREWIDSPHSIRPVLYLAKLLQLLPSSVTKGHIVRAEDGLKEYLNVGLRNSHKNKKIWVRDTATPCSSLRDDRPLQAFYF
jgi:hypothetical protein